MEVQNGNKGKDKSKFLDTSPFFELLLHNTHMTAIFILNQEGKIVRINGGVNKLYGYRSDEIIGKSISIIYTPKDVLNRVPEKILKSVLDQGSSSDLNYTVHKDGTTKWSEGETLCVKNKNGIYYVKIVHDVDEQKLLEEFLIASERKQTLLSVIFDSFLNGIEVFKCIRDKSNEIIDFEYILINKAAEKFMNRSRKDVIGKRMLEIYPDLKKTEVFENQKRAVESGNTEEVEFYHDQHGLNGWFKAAFGKFGDGLIATIEDITETKYTNLELKKTATYLKDSQEIAKVGTLEWDIKNDTITGTPALYRLLGFEKEKITLNDYMKNIGEEDKERVKQAIENSIESKDPTEIEYKFIIPDGREKIFHVKAKTLFDKNNQPEKMIGTIADVTKFKKVERDLKKAEDEIIRFNVDQKIVNARADELIMANQQLKKIIEELDKYAYIISHDLRAPLTSLEGLINLIGEDYKDKPLDLYGEEMMDLINFKIQNMKEMISQILISAKADKKIKEPVNVYSLVEEVIKILAPPSNFKIELGKELPKLKFHRTSLIQIFQNLIGNAIKYMDKKQPIISIRAFEHHTCFEILITDNGIGIPKNKIDKIFNFFEVAHDNTNIESHGLGLSIAKKLIEENGGRIWVKSEEGIGSEFRFTILKH